MKSSIKKKIWMNMCGRGLEDVQKAYEWVMEAPIHKRRRRLWCVKHQTFGNYKELLEWLNEN